VEALGKTPLDVLVEHQVGSQVVVFISNGFLLLIFPGYDAQTTLPELIIFFANYIELLVNKQVLLL